MSAGGRRGLSSLLLTTPLLLPPLFSTNAAHFVVVLCASFVLDTSVGPLCPMWLLAFQQAAHCFAACFFPVGAMHCVCLPPAALQLWFLPLPALYMRMCGGRAATAAMKSGRLAHQWWGLVHCTSHPICIKTSPLVAACAATLAAPRRRDP